MPKMFLIEIIKQNILKNITNKVIFDLNGTDILFYALKSILQRDKKYQIKNY